MGLDEIELDLSGLSGVTWDTKNHLSYSWHRATPKFD